MGSRVLAKARLASREAHASDVAHGKGKSTIGKVLLPPSGKGMGLGRGEQMIWSTNQSYDPIYAAPTSGSTSYTPNHASTSTMTTKLAGGTITSSGKAIGRSTMAGTGKRKAQRLPALDPTIVDFFADPKRTTAGGKGKGVVVVTTTSSMRVAPKSPMPVIATAVGAAVLSPVNAKGLQAPSRVSSPIGTKRKKEAASMFIPKKKVASAMPK